MTPSLSEQFEQGLHQGLKEEISSSFDEIAEAFVEISVSFEEIAEAFVEISVSFELICLDTLSIYQRSELLTMSISLNHR